MLNIIKVKVMLETIQNISQINLFIISPLCKGLELVVA